MSDSYSDPHQQERRFENNRDGGRGGYRSGKPPGNRELGGFRIRLSDNEMRSARALQEAFNLRSTVAVLGFALRTLGQMLEDGKIDELIAAQKQQQQQFPRGSNRREDGNNPNRGGRRNRFDDNKSNPENSKPKPNPFARPEKPQSTTQSIEENTDSDKKAEELITNDNESKNNQIETEGQGENSSLES